MTYPYSLWVFDIIFVSCILFNIGAIIITNALVMKETPIIKEANPFQAKIAGYVPLNKPIVLTAFVVRCFMWTILTFLYLFQRSRVHNDLSYWWFVFTMIFIASVIYLDFLNDLGFIIGKWIYA
jgi:hypothetical protein